MAWNQGEGSSSGIKFDEGGGFSFNWEEEEFDETADLLPSDPFNMEYRNQRTDFSTMTSWLEDFGLKIDENEVAKLDSFLIRKMGIHQGAGFQLIDGNCEPVGMIVREGLNGGHGLMDGDATDNDQGRIKDHCGVNEGNPHQALLLSLGYLGLGDLFVVERVSKPLRDAVVGDPLLWKNINIVPPFCTNITNDILINLTNRAQGNLHSLSLFHCSKLTDAGLKHVLDRNPNLSKLNVQGCARLTADGMLSNLKVWKTAGKTRLKYLGIYGLSGLTDKHMDEFKLLTGVDNSKLPTTRKPRFFGGGRPRVIFDDDRDIDVEVCPICQRFELVYDCTSESCQKQQSSSQLCRGCVKCIKRCFDCGCCLINCDYVELFHFESLCLDCPIDPVGSQ